MANAIMAQQTSGLGVHSTLTARSSPARPLAARPSFARSRQATLAVRASEGKTPSSDSFQKVEAPVRDGPIPDGGPKMPERQNELDREILASDGNKEKEVLSANVSLADSFRFKGALPEIANGRLAMLGFVAALGYELVSSRPVATQLSQAPVLIGATAVLFTIASLVTITKGIPRKGSGIWTAEAELLNGRTAMLGFAALLVTEALKGSAVF